MRGLSDFSDYDHDNSESSQTLRRFLYMLYFPLVLCLVGFEAKGAGGCIIVIEMWDSLKLPQPPPDDSFPCNQSMIRSVRHVESSMAAEPAR